MADVVHLRAVEPLPEAGDFLLITEVGRSRACDYFIESSPSLTPRIGPRTPARRPGYASLETAIKAAQELAARHAAQTIYVQHASVLVRPFHPSTGAVNRGTPASPES